MTMKVWHGLVVFAIALLAIWVTNKNFFGIGNIVA